LDVSGPVVLDRRTDPRSNLEIEIRYGAAGEEFVGTTIDQSGGGLGIVGPKLYPSGTELVLRFRRSGGSSDVITMNAVVRNSHSTRMGLQFVNVKPSEHPKLLATIVQLVANRPVQRASAK
jgi:c-di-GMP-binding flagellar brake protein YcgR